MGHCLSENGIGWRKIKSGKKISVQNEGSSVAPMKSMGQATKDRTA
jgi:hypothetical protein